MLKSFHTKVIKFGNDTVDAGDLFDMKKRTAQEFKKILRASSGPVRISEPNAGITDKAEKPAA